MDVAGKETHILRDPMAAAPDLWIRPVPRPVRRLTLQRGNPLFAANSH